MPIEQNKNLKTGLHKLRTFCPKGTVIFREEDGRDNAYIIERGEIEISTCRDNRQVPLVRLGAGEVFGETALLGPGKRSATATATEDTEVFTISPDILRGRIMHLDPLVGLLMSLLVNRYRRWRHVSPDDAMQGRAVAREEESLSAVNHADDFMKDLDKQKEIALSELRLAQEITRGMAENEFIPYLQPIVILPERKLAGFEALIRWNHPEKGLLAPRDFVPVAERTQVIWDLDMFMLKRACALVSQFQNAMGGDARRLYISVNLSGVHFDSSDFAAHVGEIVRGSGVNPAQIVLEITESALMGDPMTAEKTLKDLRALGLRIALDDFGTGYSSLSYLHRFSIDIIKIDRAFVQDLHNNKKSMDIVRAIISLSKTFGLGIVGEGIENENEVSALAALGCDCGQGYLFSEPLPPEKAAEFVRENMKKYG
jgi:EAL domain-containing protein (putative c-di-GMP-specific phosphodiesterase class I)/CRP-like cAMP-binding protein